MKIYLKQFHKKRGDNTFYLCFYDEQTKRVKRKSLKTTNRNQAQELLAREQARAFEYAKGKSPTIEKALNEFLAYTEISKGKGNTLKHYEKTLKPLVPYFIRVCGCLDLTDITNAHANRFICDHKNLKTSTISQKIKVCRIFYRWALKNYDLKNIENPFLSIKFPKIKRIEKNFWTPEQITEILNNAREPLQRLAFAFMAFAGLRFFEMQKIDFKHFLKNFTLLKVIGKGEKQAAVPIGKKLKKEIDLYFTNKEIPAAGRVFPESFTNSFLNSELKKITSKMKFDGAATCHRFRHSFASNLLRAGASVTEVQRLLRHSSPNITLAVYSHCLRQDLYECLEKL